MVSGALYVCNEAVPRMVRPMVARASEAVL